MQRTSQNLCLVLLPRLLVKVLLPLVHVFLQLVPLPVLLVVLGPDAPWQKFSTVSAQRICCLIHCTVYVEECVPPSPVSPAFSFLRSRSMGPGMPEGTISAKPFLRTGGAALALL
jgi:hypothetical protein